MFPWIFLCSNHTFVNNCCAVLYFVVVLNGATFVRNIYLWFVFGLSSQILSRSSLATPKSFLFLCHWLLSELSGLSIVLVISWLWACSVQHRSQTLNTVGTAVRPQDQSVERIQRTQMLITAAIRVTHFCGGSMMVRDAIFCFSFTTIWINKYSDM